MTRPAGKRAQRSADFSRWLTLAAMAQNERLTWKEIARRAGLSYSYLIQVKNGHEQVTDRVIERLEQVLGRRYQPVVHSIVRPSPSEFQLAPVYGGDPADHGPLTGYLPIPRLADPRAVKYFLEADRPPEGTPPGASAMAFLLDPEDHLPGPEPLLFAVLAPGRGAVVRWLRRTQSGVEVARNGLFGANGGSLSGAHWTPLEGMQVLGRVEELRLRYERPGPLSGPPGGRSPHPPRRREGSDV
ncbi:MAG TPA: helix-turn-helix transcriptional regulator [bacterium]|nr:helix-turn-helix transcriptional regulator [bacterium]